MSIPTQAPTHPALTRPVHEELANSLTHGLGLVLAVGGSAALIVRVQLLGTRWHVLGCIVYALTLVAVYAASTLSHAVRAPRWKRRFWILDQALVYLLIAGTFTPFALAYLPGGWWWTMWAVMWGCAGAGFLSTMLMVGRLGTASILFYVLLGWLPAAAMQPLAHDVPAAVTGWLLLGGACYTVGTVFLACDAKFPFFHAVWHVLVIAGSACHYVGILQYAVPQRYFS